MFFSAFSNNFYRLVIHLFIIIIIIMISIISFADLVLSFSSYLLKVITSSLMFSIFPFL